MHERPNAAFAFLLDRMPAGLFVTDATGRCVYVNEAVASLTGLGPGAPAQSWLRRIHPDYRGAVAHGWNRAIANGQVFLHDFPLSWPHEGVWVRCHAVPFAEPKRDLTGFVGSLSTIGGRPVEEARVAARQDLKRALHRGEFILLYQPIVSVADGRTVGAEALIRWIHPKKGLLYPGSFIPAAEESGQISAIGDWVIGEACRKAGRWRSETPGFSPYVAVNLSPAQFRDGTLAAKVWRFLGEAGLDPSAIELELTETLLVDEDGTMARTIGDLMDMGLGLSLDDFGMGYSNLAYLRRLSFDTLKIDRSFILGLPHDHGNAAIVRAVIQMAHALDMRVVAEGVEDRDTLRFLADQGCDLAQGYLLSRPMPFDELLAYSSAGS